MHSVADNKSRHDPRQEYFWPGSAPSVAQIKSAKKVELDPNDETLQLNLQRYLNAGMDMADWYNNTYPTLLNFFGGDEHKTSLFIDLLAATSPQTSIIENIDRAMMYQRALEGGWLGRYVEGFEAHFNNCCRALVGLPLQGPKVRAFQSNLTGNEENVTVDTWMMRAFGLREINDEDAHAPTMAEYRAVSKATRRFAESCGMKPREVQAAIWVGIKRIAGEPEDTTLPFEHVFRNTVNALSSQLTFDGFDRVVPDIKAEREMLGDQEEKQAANEEMGLGFEEAAVGALDIPDVSVAYNKGGAPKYKGRIVRVRLADLCAHESTIDPAVVNSIFALSEDKAAFQMQAFYCLRRHSREFIQRRELFTPELLNKAICHVPIKQYTSPEVVM
jgi:hypothetical protein